MGVETSEISRNSTTLVFHTDALRGSSRVPAHDGGQERVTNP